VRAVQLRRHGGPEELIFSEDLPTPKPGPAEVLLRNHATSINRVDLLVRSGYPGIEIPLPHVPGGDLSGEVAELGAGVDGVAPGDRVVVYPLVTCGTCTYCRSGTVNLCADWKYFGLHRWGGYAEYVVVPAACVVPLPGEVRHSDAATLPVAGLTAHHGLRLSNLSQDETLFVWGGSGGLASFAIQLALRLGARVIVSTRDEGKALRLRELGAEVVLGREPASIKTEVIDLTGGAGVDAVVDYVGPPTFAASMELLKKGGTLLLMGQIEGRETTLNIHQAYLKHIRIQGLYLGQKSELEELVALVADGGIRPEVYKQLPLPEAAEAQRLMAAGEHVGKIVLSI
jgi:NADPH:quinone reductase-like Zn-dependent oxidoreductase